MMQGQKRKALRIFFALEIVVFGWSYLFGSQGWYAIYQLSRESKKIQQQIAVVQEEIDRHQHYSSLFVSNDFYKEQIAREKLQMARADDLVVYY